MATTTNFGWTTPDDTALVKDGAAAIRTLGSSIDTSLVDLKGGTSGQVLSKNSNTDMDFTWVAQDDSNAIQNALLTTTGDTIYASGASTPARLGIGSTGQVLTVSGGVPAWASPAAGGGMTLLSTTSWSNGSGGSVTVSSINQTYKNLFIYAYGFNPSSANSFVTIDANNDQICCTSGLYAGTTMNINQNVFRIYGAGIDSGSGNNAFSCLITGYATSAPMKPFNVTGLFTVASTQRGSVVGGGYPSTSAITSLVFNVSGANSISGGTILIYGVN